ncbi:hypothetical protein ILP97_65760, partial [Amycolatopsis sp. H6(2020)]|nr:hypothetical protein [Amycolatopsis sp. H6(2020)]
ARRRSAERIRHLEQRRELAERHERAEHERTETLERYERLQSARLRDAAATLAEDLVPGRPCPVCGSREHPDPHAGAMPGSVPGGADSAPGQTEAGLDRGAGDGSGQAAPPDLSPRALQEARRRRDAALAEAQRILEALARV